MKKEIKQMIEEFDAFLDKFTGKHEKDNWLKRELYADTVQVRKDLIIKEFTRMVNQIHTQSALEAEGRIKEFTPAENIQIGGLESDEWELVPREDGMYCLNCKRFTPEEGCLCGMVSLTDIADYHRSKVIE